MVGFNRWQTFLLGLVLLPCVLAGCQTFYPLPDDPVPSTNRIDLFYPEVETPAWALLSQQAKNRVYIYLLNGNDPWNTGNLLGVRDYLHARGFIKTSYGQQFHGPWFEAEIAAIHEAEPTARFVLVGFSAAAGPANQLARRLGAQGIEVDRLIYLDGVLLFRSPEWVKPENVGEFVNVRSQGYVHGEEREGAENIEIEGTGHFDVPSHPKTLALLLREATEVGEQVPVVVDLPSPLREGPRPTPLVEATIHHLAPEWDFLRPDFMGNGPVYTRLHKPASTSPNR